MKAPTHTDMTEAEWDDSLGLAIVHRESDPSWRHGSREEWVFYRESDDSYWRARFRLSTCGETNELREGLADIARVYPHEVATTEYRDGEEPTGKVRANG